MNKLKFIIFFLIVNFSYGLDIPLESRFDSRIKHTNYNQNDVVHLDAVIGMATHIELQEEEDYVTHAFGDSEAWQFSNTKNHYFLKPVAEEASTNLTIVTSKRTYYFILNYKDKINAKGTYALKFRYPDDERKKYNKAYEKQMIEHHFLSEYDRNRYNLEYTMSGDTTIAPINIWDDGEFTYLKFLSTQDLPVITYSATGQEEALVNRHQMGAYNNIIVMHKIIEPHEKWVIRLDQKNLSIFNDRKIGLNDEYEKLLGINKKINTGTKSEKVIRVKKNND